jgi:hypothetical protein
MLSRRKAVEIDDVELGRWKSRGEVPWLEVQ